MPDARLEQLTDFTFAYAGGPRFYVGFATVPRTASGSGVGGESASGTFFTVFARSATGSGAGSEFASGNFFTVSRVLLRVLVLVLKQHRASTFVSVPLLVLVSVRVRLRTPRF